MIPKTINYCWFGDNPKDELFYKCLKSWKNFFPNYEIIEWNEKNFDINQNQYMKEAYESKKYAFVSDYARLKIIYDNGGIYFDTDVEVLKDMQEIIEKGAFFGCELDGVVSSGLGFGAEKHNFVIKKMLEQYDNLQFKTEKGLDTTPCIKYNTQALLKNGWNKSNEIEKVKDVYVYPVEYFSPYNYLTGKSNITEKTYTYHHGNASWLPEYERNLFKLKKKLVEKFGQNIGKMVYYFVKFIVLIVKNPTKIFKR